MKTPLEDDLKDIRKSRKRYLLLLLLLVPLIIFALVIRSQSHKTKPDPEIKSYLKAVAACEDIESEDLRLRCVRMMQNINLDDESGAIDSCENLENAELAARCRNERVRHLAAKNPDTALALCKSGEDYDLNCVSEAGGYAALKTLSRGDEFCRKLKALTLQATCYRGIAKQVGVTDRGAAKAVCDLLTNPPVRSACYAGLGEAMARDRGRTAAKAWCEAQEDVDQASCLSGVD